MGSWDAVTFTQAQVRAALEELKSLAKAKDPSTGTTQMKQKRGYPKVFKNNLGSDGKGDPEKAVFVGASNNLFEYPLGPDINDRSKLWSETSTDNPPGRYRVVAKSDGSFKGVMQKGQGGENYYECDLDKVASSSSSSSTAAMGLANGKAARRLLRLPMMPLPRLLRLRLWLTLAEE